MKTTTITSTLSLIAGLALAEPAKTSPPVDPKPAEAKVQIALLLDTSNSMDGLIDQTKTQLWKVVNTFINAERDGTTPYVEVALYEYGNNDQHVGNHYIRQVQPFTRELDELSNQLFALKTNGGDEYCGAVIQRALADLNWDKNTKTYKAIFIAGNEPFTQGSVDPMQACRDTFGQGIIVNTIHCGPRQSGISGSWHDGAAIGGGEFMVIDQDRAVSHIPAPQDKKISDLGIKLNKTYLGYGQQWSEKVAKQSLADSDALANEAAGANVQRAISKASKNYHNSSWDLVDAVREKQVDLTKVDKSELPPELRKLSTEELKQKVAQAAKKRAAIQKEIAELNRARTDYVAEQRRKQADENSAKTLDEVMVETTRTQAKKLGYEFKR